MDGANGVNEGDRWCLQVAGVYLALIGLATAALLTLGGCGGEEGAEDPCETFRTHLVYMDPSAAEVTRRDHDLCGPHHGEAVDLTVRSEPESGYGVSDCGWWRVEEIPSTCGYSRWCSAWSPAPGWPYPPEEYVVDVMVEQTYTLSNGECRWTESVHQDDVGVCTREGTCRLVD